MNTKGENGLTPLEAALILIYVLWAVARQAAHDGRTIRDWITR